MDLGSLERVTDVNLGVFLDDVRLLPAAEGCARADVVAAHLGALDASPAADHDDGDRDDCHSGQGEQSCSRPVRGNMELEDMDASFLLKADLGFGHLVGPKVGGVRGRRVVEPHEAGRDGREDSSKGHGEVVDAGVGSEIGIVVGTARSDR